MLEGYQPDAFFDEMFQPDRTVRPHCKPLYDRIAALDQKDFDARKATCELYFLKQGVTFNVYHDSRGSERIFPFEPVPRVIPAHEWDHLESGLIQRITALNLFLHDIYHDQQILKDGIIPRSFIEQARHYRP
ncbi:MAG: circularly permuted type 2 ATP-grasp protein, partial [Akkermansiaceae bacterium]